MLTIDRFEHLKCRFMIMPFGMGVVLQLPCWIEACWRGRTKSQVADAAARIALFGSMHLGPAGCDTHHGGELRGREIIQWRALVCLSQPQTVMTPRSLLI